MGNQHRGVNAGERQRARLVLLVGWPDNDEAAVGAGDRAADEDDMVLGVDLDDVEVANGALGIAILAGGLVTFLGPAGAAIGGVRADRTARAMDFLGAVGGGQAMEIVALHDAGEAAALGGADH